MTIVLSDDEIGTSRIGGPSDPNVRELTEAFGRLGRPSELRPSKPKRMDPKLCKILGIDDPAAFLEHRWEQEACVMRRGAGVFRDLFSVPIIDRLLATRRLAWKSVGLKDVTRRRPGAALSSYDRVPDLRGMALDMREMESCWPPLRRLHDLLERSFDRPAISVAFLTPPGGQHLDLHWDLYDLFVLQVSGTKRWRVYKPLITLPGDNQEFINYRFEGRRPELEVELEEGDVLYTPRGWPHQARTGSSHSLHVAIGLGTVSWHHVIGRGWRHALEAAHGELTQNALATGIAEMRGREKARAERLVDHLCASLRRADHAALAQDESFFPTTRPPISRSNYQRGNILMYRDVLKRKRGRARASYTSRGQRYLTRTSVTGTTLVFDERKVEVPKNEARELAYVLSHRSFCPVDRPAGVHSGRLTRLADRLTDAGFLSRHITWQRP